VVYADPGEGRSAASRPWCDLATRGAQAQTAPCSTDRPPSERPRIELAKTRAIMRASADGGVGDWGSTDLAWEYRPTGIAPGWMDLAAAGLDGAIQPGAAPYSPGYGEQPNGSWPDRRRDS
jgi:hypothetical protein